MFLLSRCFVELYSAQGSLVSRRSRSSTLRSVKLSDRIRSDNSFHVIGIDTVAPGLARVD